MVADRGPGTAAVTIIFIVLATVFVAARFFTRIWLVRSIKQDDWWILAAWLFAVGFSASICVGTHYGLGRHQADIPHENLAALHKADYAFSVLYNPCLMLTKTSIIVFYLSVMSKDADVIFKWCNWLTLALVNVAGLALTLYNILQCMPVRAAWTFPALTGATCTNIISLYLSSAPVNIITDIAILFLPMPILTGMRLPRKQKIILVATFSFGAFVAVVDVVRLAYLQKASTSRLDRYKNGTPPGTHQIQDASDFPWYAALSFMWSAIEVNLGIICACVPSLKPLFLRFMPQLIKNTEEDSTTASHSSIDAGPPKGLAEAVKGNVSMLNHPAAFRKPMVKEYNGEDEGDEMGFLNMLAGPTNDMPRLTKTRTNMTLTRQTTAASDFDFVKMSSNKNMLKLTNKQSFGPIATVTVIFFLWGFAYGLLNTLNAQFQKVTNLSTRQGLGLHAAYFGAYFVGPLTLGRFVLKRYGFRASMMAGLCVYGCGTLVFWPSAVLTSYTAFVISNFIVAFGLSCLEVAANPYIALCGPLEYAEVRLNFSQAFQAVGTVCSALLANKVMFQNITGSASLVDVQWAYLGIALFVYGLAVVFYYIPLPEASDDELEEQQDKRSAVYRAQVGPFRVIYVTLALGVLSQWCYVGTQESIGDNVEPLISQYVPNRTITPFDYDMVGHTIFAVGRFLAAVLNYVLKPRWILLFLYMALVIMCGIQMGVTGTAAAGVQMAIFLFEAGIFSIVFAISMRGLGAHTKTGSAFMTAGISGGVVGPVIQWAVTNGHGLKYSYCVPLAMSTFGMIFAIYLNVVPQARHQVDPIHEKRIARRERRALDRQNSGASVDSNVNQFGLAGIIGRRKKAKGGVASSQHIEQRLRSPTPMMKEKPDEEIVQMSAPQGILGALQRWGQDDLDDSSSSQQSSEAITPAVNRHRPMWGDEKDEDGFDDYHAMMRKI